LASNASATARRSEPAHLLAVAARLLGEGVAFALITVVRATRPTSGKPGDKAILTETGEWLGWVGGSCAEPAARRAAAQALHDGECRLIHITNDEADVVRPGVELAAMTCHSGGSLEIYVEPHLPRPNLIVFGRSPIARALCELGRLMKYRVVSADLQAGASAGGAADDAPLDPATQRVSALVELASVPAGRRVVVVASHGRQEVEALEWALRSRAEGGEAEYVGLVSSRRRLPDVLERLRERGVSAAGLGRLRAPAGLSIGARGPEEVALSILSEVVARRLAESGSESESESGSESVAVGRPRRSCCDV
jgi:xanthine dehydrogenase accessory factor